MAVTPADIAHTLGRSTPPSATSTTYKQWSLWIDDARRIIKNRLGNLDALDQDDLDYVVREAVAEKTRNVRADGTTSKTVTVDDGTVTKRWEDGKPTTITILDEWWDMLTPDHVSRGAFTINPIPARRRCW